MDDVPLDDVAPGKPAKKSKTQVPSQPQPSSNESIQPSLGLGGLTTSLWSVASQATATIKQNVDKVKEEYEKLCRDHDGLIRMGASYGSFDPLGKLAFLDALEAVEGYRRRHDHHPLRPFTDRQSPRRQYPHRSAQLPARPEARRTFYAADR